MRRRTSVTRPPAALEFEAIEVLRAWRHLRRTGAPVSPELLSCVDRAIDKVLERATREPQDAQGIALEALEALQAVFGDRAFIAREAIRMAWDRSSPPAQRLDLALRQIAKSRGAPLTPMTIGSWLRRQDGQVVGALRIARAGAREHTTLWRVFATMKA